MTTDLRSLLSLGVCEESFAVIGAAHKQISQDSVLTHALAQQSVLFKSFALYNGSASWAGLHIHEPKKKIQFLVFGRESALGRAPSGSNIAVVSWRDDYPYHRPPLTIPLKAGAFRSVNRKSHNTVDSASLDVVDRITQYVLFYKQ